jgi:hypothetical protein
MKYNRSIFTEVNMAFIRAFFRFMHVFGLFGVCFSFFVFCAAS